MIPGTGEGREGLWPIVNTLLTNSQDTSLRTVGDSVGRRGGGEQTPVAGASTPAVHSELTFKPQSTARHKRSPQQDTGIIEEVPGGMTSDPHLTTHSSRAPGGHIVSGINNDVILSQNI